MDTFGIVIIRRVQYALLEGTVILPVPQDVPDVLHIIQPDRKGAPANHNVTIVSIRTSKSQCYYREYQNQQKTMLSV